SCTKPANWPDRNQQTSADPNQPGADPTAGHCDRVAPAWAFGFGQRRPGALGPQGEAITVSASKPDGRVRGSRTRFVFWYLSDASTQQSALSIQPVTSLYAQKSRVGEVEYPRTEC